jgi:alkanesulfonate monooxygenase SsuD/methylene tetrahydromethanopterin reductase-like flavin-dependent oxidoreductase (luciferase family)
MPIETGVMFRREQDPATLVSYAQRVEAMGFDQLWVVEDCFYHGGIAQAAMALAVTNRLKVGMGINPAVARKPAFLAMEYATLANAFPGRFIGGIGHGVSEWMDQIGEKPASWLTSISEITSSTRRILRGELVSMDGHYAQLRDVQLELPPETVPPVLLGVQGEKSIRVAGECADGILVIEGSGVEYVLWAQDLMNEGRAAGGQADPGRVVVYANCVVDDASPATARQFMREIVARDNGVALRSPVTRMAFAPEMAEMAARGGADALRDEMPDEWVSRLAITGSHAEAREAVRRFAETGGEAVILVPPEDADWDAWLAKQGWATTSES